MMGEQLILNNWLWNSMDAIRLSLLGNKNSVENLRSVLDIKL